MDGAGFTGSIGASIPFSAFGMTIAISDLPVAKPFIDSARYPGSHGVLEGDCLGVSAAMTSINFPRHLLCPEATRHPNRSRSERIHLLTLSARAKSAKTRSISPASRTVIGVTSIPTEGATALSFGPSPQARDLTRREHDAGICSSY
jgi:hypothetical protein